MGKSIHIFSPFWRSFFPHLFCFRFFSFEVLLFDFPCVFFFCILSSLKSMRISYRGEHKATIARRRANIAPKMAPSWSKRGQHSRKLGQPRPKMRLLQTLRMGHNHSNNNSSSSNKNNNTSSSRSSSNNNNSNSNNTNSNSNNNNNRRPYKHTAIYGVSWLSHTPLFFKTKYLWSFTLSSSL